MNQGMDQRKMAAVFLLALVAALIALLWPPCSRGGRAGHGGPGGDGTGGKEQTGAGGGEGAGAGVEKEAGSQPGPGAGQAGEPGPSEAVMIPELGLAVAADASGARVVSVREGGPGDAAGLAAGDAIDAVDGAAVAGKAAEAVAKALSGDAGSQVTVTVRGPGEDVRQVTMTRSLAPKPPPKQDVLKAPAPAEKAMWDTVARSVRRMLKDPASARFPDPGVEGTAVAFAGSRCVVTGYVESSLPSGGRAVSRFRCALLKPAGREAWIVESVEFLD